MRPTMSTAARAIPTSGNTGETPPGRPVTSSAPLVARAYTMATTRMASGAETVIAAAQVAWVAPPRAGWLLHKRMLSGSAKHKLGFTDMISMYGF